jgi:hypothetical protein
MDTCAILSKTVNPLTSSSRGDIALIASQPMRASFRHVLHADSSGIRPSCYSILRSIGSYTYDRRHWGMVIAQ